MVGRVLSIDPSGTGTTGIFFTDGKKQLFNQFKDICWKKHYDFIVSSIKLYKPTILLYEDTNYIHKRTADSLSLFRLLGAIECLPVKEVGTVNVVRVKEMSKALLVGKRNIPNLEYLVGRGKGWMFNGSRVSIHCLEAFIVYYLWRK